MDPAALEKIKQALSLQSAHMGEHEREIQGTTESLQALTTQATLLGARVDQLVTLLTVVSPPTSMATTPEPVVSAPTSGTTPESHEHFMPNSARFSGMSGTCSQFLHQCSLVFDQQMSYATDKSKTAFIMGFYFSWRLTCRSFLLSYYFEMSIFFDCPLQGIEAGSQLLSLHQGEWVSHRLCCQLLYSGRLVRIGQTRSTRDFLSWIM